MSTVDVVQLVDSVEYIDSNCYQHQLHEALLATGCVVTATLDEEVRGARRVVSCLRLRNLDRQLNRAKQLVGSSEFVVYDQDPWESFKSDGACRGAYERIADAVPRAQFAVTTRTWAERLRRAGFDAQFVRMGLSRQYCCRGPSFDRRPTRAGFMGSLHSFRRELFEQLAFRDVHVDVRRGGRSYDEYLDALSTFKFFVHREEAQYEALGETIQYGEGLWIKDVEAAARGCFSVRNRHPEIESYVDLDRVQTVLTYATVDELVAKVEAVEAMDPEERESLCQNAVETIAADDAWSQTARKLIG